MNEKPDSVSPAKPVRLERKVLYENPWVNLYIDRVRFPAGRIIEKHHLLDFPKEAMAGVVENAAGDLLLIEAYRYTTDSIEWEVPAGNFEPGETVEAAARREIFEETGYETEGHVLLNSYYPMAGIANKRFHTVRCRAVRSTGIFDRNEVKAVHWISPRKAAQMLSEGIIADGMTIIALMLVLCEFRQV